MVMSKQSPNEPSISIIVNNIKIGQVERFNYLGSWITTDGRCGKEIRRRINLSKSSFNSTKNIFRERQLSIQLKTRLLKCFVWPVLMYGCKTWTVTTRTRKNLEAAEMWFYRRILRIPWTAHQTNVSVLQRMGQDRKLLCCTEQRQFKFLGHVIRKGELEDLALSVRIPENVQEVPNVLLSSITLKVCAKILGNYGRLHEIEHNGRTSYYIEGWISHYTEREIMH